MKLTEEQTNLIHRFVSFADYASIQVLEEAFNEISEESYTGAKISFDKVCGHIAGIFYKTGKSGIEIGKALNFIYRSSADESKLNDICQILGGSGYFNIAKVLFSLRF